MIKRYLAPAVVALALLTAACGGGGGGGQDSGVASIDGKKAGGGSSGQKAKAVDREKAALAFAKCMRANGANVPDPDANGMFAITPDQQPPDPEAMARAETKCRKERAALQGSMGEPPKDFQDKVLKMSRCMREHGVDMPDPRIGSSGEAAVEIDPSKLDDPEFQKAQETCRKKVGLPKPGGAPGVGK